MSCLSAAEAEPFLHTFIVLLCSELSYFDNIHVHGVGVMSFGGGGEGMVGLMRWFGVSFGDFFGTFPLGLERNGFFVPVIDGGRDCVHRHDSAHEGQRDTSREIPNKDILVGDACEGQVVFEVGNILDKGWGVGVVLPLGHTFGGEPGDSIAGGVMVLECSFELCDKVREGSHGYGGSRDGVLPKCGCPGKGGSFSHIGEGEGNHFVVGVIDFVVDEEVEAYSVQPLGGFLVGSIKGFRCSDAEFGGF